MSALPLRFISKRNPSTRVHDGWLFDDQTVAVVTSNIAAGVGKGDLADLIRVEPDLSLTAFENRGRKPFL